MIQIENDDLIVGINSKGAELASVRSKQDDFEYIWKADPAYWGRHSCILFPVIGANHNNVIHLAGQEYPMKKHGIVRDEVFELISKTEKEAIFEIRSTKDSRSMYPFDWALRAIYNLEGSTCRIIYEVENLSKVALPFSLGGHPGITCPLSNNKQRSDYHLLFEQLETQNSPLLNDEGLITSDVKRILDNSNRIDIEEHLFDEDALILSNFNSSSVSIVENDGNSKVTVGIEGFSHLGIWSQARTSPFVCIEPWFGHADPDGYDGDFYDKTGNVTIKAGKVFNCEHWIRVDLVLYL